MPVVAEDIVMPALIICCLNCCKVAKEVSKWLTLVLLLIKSYGFCASNWRIIKLFNNKESKTIKTRIFRNTNFLGMNSFSSGMAWISDVVTNFDEANSWNYETFDNILSLDGSRQEVVVAWDTKTRRLALFKASDPLSDVSSFLPLPAPCSI